MFIFKENCKNSRNIEIVSSYAAFETILKSNFKDNVIICMPLCLSIGDLNTLKYYDRNSIKLVHDYIDEELNYKDDMEKFIKLLENADNIRIWSSHLDDDEYLLLLYLSNFIKESNIYVIFSEEYQYTCYSISCMTSKEINELSKREHRLTKNDISYFKYQWNEILNENSDYRYLHNGNIKNVSFNYFFEDILSFLKDKGEILTSKFIAYLMAYKVINNASDDLYRYIINLLIDEKKIKIIESGKKHPKVINEGRKEDYYNLVSIM